MLSARRKSDGEIVTADMERKFNAPFFCLECNEEVILKSGRNNIDHFAHANPIACKFGEGESETHRKCKKEIFEALLREPNVSGLELERPLGAVRPDISGYIRGIPVAIEVQISSLSLDTIMQRTIEYHRIGIYVLWLLQWTPALDADRYAPRLWEKWIHAAYFGRVYYWTEGLTVIPYKLEPHRKAVPRQTWFSANGKKMKSGGYTAHSTRYRTPIRGNPLNLARDFIPKARLWWEGGGFRVPDAKLFLAETHSPISHER